MDRVALWNGLAAQFCIDGIRASTAAGSGHPTSSMSSAHLLAVLYADHLRFDVAEPRALANDRLVLSKGHASPLIFSVLKAIGAIDDAQLMSFRKMGSPIQGHPVPLPDMPYIDVATGSLGQGLPIGLGMALAMRLDENPARVWVLMGDSEMAEGSVWEAMANASHHGVANLVGICDMNRLGQRGPTMLQWDGAAYVSRASAFGWNAIAIDGHDVVAIDEAYRQAEAADRPTLIVARTRKGNGVSFLQDAEGWHGRPLSAAEAESAIVELGGERSLTFTPPAPAPWTPPGAAAAEIALPAFEDGVATRKAFGETLAALAARPDVVVLDGEVSNSTYTEDFQKVAPERFVELYIAEQCMAGVAVGLQALGKVVYAATFGAFLTRAYDFVRMAAVSRASLRLCGSHAGVSIGEDGPSQMALEDLAMMRAVHGSTVLYPSDGNSAAHLTAAMADVHGISYIRTTREKTPVLYGADEEFEIGGSKTLRASAADEATIVAAGVTVFEALKAADELEAKERRVRVIDAYSVKPIDADTLIRAMDQTGLLVVVEDHWLEGGLGEAVLSALAHAPALSGRVVKLGVGAMPGSGTPEELREWAGISADQILARVEGELALRAERSS
ncbi:MAG: transketolase [Actinobacteria bacterium RBG_19FT_COMBO_70_19]|nr:MAG: transketolase [Actinobacteria bacterium RBG_19FT_COMBO_70_19]